MRRVLLASLVAGLGVFGCKSDKEKAEPAEQPAAAETPAMTATEEPGKVHGSGTGGGVGGGSGSGANDMVNKMMHCPSAVEGSTTKVEPGKEAVTVTVTAGDPARVAEIQKRAKHLASLTSATAAPEVKHTGQGTGGGALGKCPVVMKDVTLKVTDQKDGARVMITPKNAAALGELAKTAKDRADALAAAAKAPEEGEDDEEADEE